MTSQEFSKQSSSEPELESVLSTFDVTDVKLQMAYVRYIDRPTKDRLHDVRNTADDLTEAFAHLLRKTIMGENPVFDESARNALLVMVLATANNEHTKCIAEYTDSVAVWSDEELVTEKQKLLSCLEETPCYESQENYVVHATDHLTNILRSDWEAIEIALEERENRLQQRILRHLGEAAKMAAAAAVGVMITEKLKVRQRE